MNLFHPKNNILLGHICGMYLLERNCHDKNLSYVKIFLNGEASPRKRDKLKNKICDYIIDNILKVKSCKLKRYWKMIAYVFHKYPENFAFQLFIILQ